MLDLEDLAKFSGEAQGENRTTIGDNRGRKAMKSENPLDKEFSKLLRVIIISARDKVGHLCETIHNNPNGIETIGIWKVDD